jgi:hypothetical protein
MDFLMDNQTNIKQLKELVKKFSEELEWDQYHNAKDLAIAIIADPVRVIGFLRITLGFPTVSLFISRFRCLFHCIVH